MKYKITTIIDTETGDYEMTFNNLTDKSAGIDYNIAMEAMRRIFIDFRERTGGKVNLGEEELRGDN